MAWELVVSWDDAKPGDVVARQSPAIVRLVKRRIRRKGDAKLMAQLIGAAGHVWLDGAKTWAVVQFEREG